MRRLYTPSTSVPGAQRVFGADNVPLFDKRGRPVWEMPRPTSMVIHNAVVRLGTFKTKREKIEVPVYRGFDGSLVRDIKSAIRRRARKDAEKKATGAHKIEIPDDVAQELSDE